MFQFKTRFTSQRSYEAVDFMRISDLPRAFLLGTSSLLLQTKEVHLPSRNMGGISTYLFSSWLPKNSIQTHLNANILSCLENLRSLILELKNLTTPACFPVDRSAQSWCTSVGRTWLDPSAKGNKHNEKHMFWTYTHWRWHGKCFIWF